MDRDNGTGRACSRNNARIVCVDFTGCDGVLVRSGEESRCTIAGPHTVEADHDPGHFRL